MPFTDMWITPTGKLGICCCDNFEVTNFGDLNQISLKEAWNSPIYQQLRRKVKDGRQNWISAVTATSSTPKLRTDNRQGSAEAE